MIKRSLSFLLTVFCVSFAFTQDIQRSHYYGLPLELNPAYTGGAPFFSVYTNYRNQYPGLDNAFNSFHFSGDYHLKNRNSGVGVSINSDRAGQGNLNSNSLHFLYAQGIELNRKWQLRLGAKVGLIFRDLGFRNLVFADQIGSNGGIKGSSAEPLEGNSTVILPDAGIGGILSGKKLWLGIAVDHVNTPKQGFIDDNSRLQRKYVAHAGYKFPFINAHGRQIKGLSEVSVMPLIQYKLQGSSSQFDAGVHLLMEPFMTGIWYRGLPLPQFAQEGLLNNDALIVLLGLKLNDFKFYYSYDIGIGGMANTNGGAHEITLSTNLAFYKNGIKRYYSKMLPSPLL